VKRLLAGLLAVLVLLPAAGRSDEKSVIRRRPPYAGRAQIEVDLRKGLLPPSKAALYRVQAIFAPEALPEKYREPAAPGRRRCLTSELSLVHRDWDVLPGEGRRLVPPYMHPSAPHEEMFVRKGRFKAGATLDAAALGKTDPGDQSYAPPYDSTYATTNFLIHWISVGDGRLVQNQDSNHDGIPDMVEQTGAVLEATRAWLLSRGYRMPIDTNDYYVNIYFDDIGPYYLGLTYPIDYPSTHSRAFIVLTSDFSGGTLPDGSLLSAFDAMRTTATHEFFHACQFAYDAMEDHWWMEATAVWSQEQPGPAWDDVNDYLWHVIEYLYYPEVALDDPNASWHWYSDVMWALFLHHHIDPDGSIIREIWETCEGTTALQANRDVLAAHVAGGFDEAWLDFLVANYKADYPEAAQFPAEYGFLWVEPTIYTYPTGTRIPEFPPAGLASNYVRFYPSGLAGYNLHLTWNGLGISPWSGILMTRNGAAYTRSATYSGTPAEVRAFNEGMDEAMLIVTPTMSGLYNSQTWSFNASLILGDGLPPTPNPMTFQVAPYAVDSTSVSMTATEAVDAESPPTEYEFDETTGGPGADDSGWTSSRVYTDGGLAVNTRYSYRVRARDSAAVPNVARYSDSIAVYTAANTPAAPSVYNPSPTKLYLALGGGDGNPSHTEYAVYNVTAGVWVAADGAPSATPWWATRPAWEGMRVTGLSPATTYSFAVKARNGDNVETAFSPGGAGTTLAADTTPPVTENVAIIPTWVKENLTTSVTVTATGNDAAHGGSDIIFAEYFVDSDPGAGSGTPMQAADGAFNSPVEPITGQLNTTGWSYVENPYDLYVRVLDDAGFWSAPAHYEINVVDGIPPARITDLSARPAPPQVATPLALSLVYASSETAGHEAANAADGSTGTSWITEAAAEPSEESIIFETGSQAYLGKVEIYPADTALFPPAFRVKLYDGETWFTVVSETDYQAQPGANAWQFGARKAERLALEIEATPLHAGTGLYAVEIAEIVLYTESCGSRAVELTWTAPSDVGPTGRADLYQVRFSDDEAELSAGFGGQAPPDAPPVPAAPGLSQGMDVTGLDPGRTLFFAVRSRDQYDNWSEVSPVASTTTLPDPNPYVALDAPLDESSLEIPAAPVFRWHANLYDYFRVQFSNVPDFPLRPYRDDRRRLARTLRFGVRRGETTFEPSVGQWRLLKRLASDMDGTLYWRVEARALRNRELGVGYSEVFCQYGFDTGIFTGLQIGPYHLAQGNVAVWPNNRPQFVWNVTKAIYGTYWLDFAATPDININDRRNTYCLRSGNGSRTWCRPSRGQWRTIKRKFAEENDGRIYWRVRAIDEDRAFQAASQPQLLVIDSPTFNLRKPGPRRDGSVHPEEAFTLDWGVDSEGYEYFRPQISTSPDFPRGFQTLNLPFVRNGASVEVNPFLTRRIGIMLDRAGGGDTFYWRVIAMDRDRTVTVESEPQEVVLSVEPIGGVD